MVLESLRYDRGEGSNAKKLLILDQKRLPHETVWVDVVSAKDAYDVIRCMQVRGAPLIAITAALGLAVDANAALGGFQGGAPAAEKYLLEQLDYLRGSRPTAVNLFNMCDIIGALVHEAAAAEGATANSVVAAFTEAAEAMLEADELANRRQGRFGMEAILATPKCRNKNKVSVLTHCNTGALACGAFGTALGVIRTLQEAGRLSECFATETRPYNQGARLTAYEFVQDGLPGTLVTDSMAAALMASGRVDAVAVGADRVAANGDTANKIGTYQLAIVAAYHKIPFFVVCPLTTVDPAIESGAQIVIEERAAHELTSVEGVKVAAPGIKVWNPAFDVTPAALITGIVTDGGTLYPVSSASGPRFHMRDFLADYQATTDGGPPQPPKPPSAALNSPGYRPLTGGDASSFVLSVPGMVELLGTSDSSEVSHDEVGDGNLNLVFLCRGPKATVVVKQALPYVRCVGESWPLSLERAHFEAMALAAEAKGCPEHVPEVYHFDPQMGAIVMRYIEPPHIVLRKALIEGKRFNTAARHLAEFMAQTLFRSSGLALTAPELRGAVEIWTRNHAMCALTEQVVFTDPYMEAPLNHWTSPQLDDLAASLRTDLELKTAVQLLKTRFVENTEALIHGDLHTGSIMAMEGSTFCIDPEFAFYGPMGFDVGALLANYLLSYFSQPGNAGAEHARWVLEQVPIIWNTFASRFCELWSDAAISCGDLFPRALFAAQEELAAAQNTFLAGLWRDTLGFAGAKIIRRIVGVAHVEDMEGIVDADLRASCEKKAVALARQMITAAAGFPTVEALASAARALAEARDARDA